MSRGRCILIYCGVVGALILLACVQLGLVPGLRFGKPIPMNVFSMKIWREVNPYQREGSAYRAKYFREAEALLKRGMTVEEVVKLFGQPDDAYNGSLSKTNPSASELKPRQGLAIELTDTRQLDYLGYTIQSEDNLGEIWRDVAYLGFDKEGKLVGICHVFE